MKKWYHRAFCGLMALAMAFCLTASPALAEQTGDWDSFRGGYGNNGVTAARTARTPEEAALKWELALKSSTDWETAISDPVQADGTIYVAVGSELAAINGQGEVTARVPLAAPIGYTCRLLYVEGKIVAPLSGGRLQCLAADSLDSLWITDAVVTEDEAGESYEHQALTTLSYGDGLVYAGTADASWSDTYGGVYQCVDAATGEVVWKAENTGKGYYWSGAVLAGKAVVYAGDDGVVTSRDAKTGALLDQLEVGGAVRSTLVLQENTVYFSTQNGLLHKVAVADDGTLGGHQSVAFAQSSTSTPAVYGGKAYVGGVLGKEQQYAGVLAVVDASTMQVERVVKAPADVKASPLVTSAYQEETYVYYTANTTPGALYVLKSGEDEGQALFVPQGDGQNYCMASVMAGSDGTLYYTNDSGRLFAVASNASDEGGESGESSSSSAPGSSEPSQSGGSSAPGAGSGDVNSSNSPSNPPTGEGYGSIVLLGVSSLALGVMWVCARRRREA